MSIASRRTTSGVDFGRVDRCRRPTPLAAAGTVLGGKEWHHVVVHHPDASVLVNFSETVDVMGRPLVRALVMVHSRQWVHEVLTASPGRHHIGAINLEMRLDDRASFVWTGDRYLATFNGSRIELDLELVPRTEPQVLTGATLSANERISWVIVPRLSATGRLRVGDNELVFAAVPSYHDHNWGNFAWGGDFAWEWITVTGDDWSLTASRLLDGHRCVTTSHFLLFEDGDRSTVFRDAEVEVRASGLLGPVPSAVVPGVLRVVAPTSVDDIPQTFTVSARRGDDTVRATITPDAVARVMMPSDTRCDAVVVLAETVGTATVDASIGGRLVSESRRGVLELLR